MWQEQVQFADAFDAKLSGAIGSEKGIETDNLHVQARGTAGHLAANAAETDDAQGLAGQLDADKLAALPLARLQARGGERNVAGQGHHHGDGMLGGGNGIAARRVHDQDAAARGGGHVDVIDAHTGPHNGPQLAGVLEQIRRHLRAAANNHAVGQLQSLQEGIAV